MRSNARLALVVLITLPAAAAAQTSPPANVGDNANIIPIYKSGDPPAVDDYLRGNLLGQRCNEPSIGISSINPDHMIVFCNDYRATFNYDDALVPSGKTTLVASVWNGVKTFFAWVTGRRKAPKGEPEEGGERIIASAEAAVGGGVSYDGGITWHGFMVPGGPNDSTPASLVHPGKVLNLQGYSDPFAVSMKDGRVGVAYIGFTRDKTTGQSTQSGIFFTRYRDRNASDVVHDWEYELSSQVALSQNLTQGQFLDKVSATVGPTGTLYIAYTRFTGSSGSSNIYLAQSVNGGVTWTSSSIDTNAKYGQATIALVHPTDATAVGVLWRTFGTSTLLYKSTAKGAKNVDLFASDPGGPYRPFDQYSQPINDDKNRVAFRALAFPAAAYTPDGTRLVAVFTEWIDPDNNPNTPGSMPMVVMKVSTNKGATWSNRYVLNWVNGEYGAVPASPERLGFFSPARAVGAQLMPAVACSVGNQCLVVWKQSFEASLQPGGLENTGSYVTSGFDRRFDVRGALVTFPSAAPSVTKSFQVSRYGYKEPEGAEKPGDVHDTDAWVAKMELPNGTRYAMVDRGNINHTGAGRVAFAGDYIGVKEVVAPGGGSPTFMVAFSDNRYNIWPWQTETGGLVTRGEEWRYYPVFMAPDDPENKIPGVSCVNYGSRVQSVMAAKVSASALQLTAATNHKDFTTATAPLACGGSLVSGAWVPSEQCIEFPVTVRNNTGTKQTVALSLTGSSSFAKRPYRTDLGEAPYTYKLTTGSVDIFPYSSYSLNVYAFNGNRITVTAGAGGTTAALALNDPAVANASAPADFTYVPSTVNIESGGLRSGGLRSGGLRSGGLRSGTPVSYPVPEDPVPGKTVFGVIDQTYVVTPSSADDAGTYLSLFNIDPAYEGSYVFQVFVTKPLTSFMTDQNDNDCPAFNFTEGALVGHISDPTNPLVNGGLRSGGLRSGGLRSGGLRSAIPSEGDPLVQNTSFTLGSSTETASGGLAALSSAELTCPAPSSDHCRIDCCTLAAPRLRSEATILVRAYQIVQNPAVVYDPDGSRTGTPTPPSVAVAEYSCDDPSCTAALGPDLVVQTDPAPAPPIVPNTRVKAGGQVTFPTVWIRNEGVDGQCGTEADPRPCGEARAHEWAVYASTAAAFDAVPRWNCAVESCGTNISGTVKLNDNPSNGAVTVLLKAEGHDALSVGYEEEAVVGGLTLPPTIPRTNADGTGTYYLYFYDDRGRIVNELDETNNDWTEGPIIVEAPGYGFLGLQTPCTGTTCNKTGTLPLAWQFTNGSTPVDSVSTLPRLTFYGSCPAPLGLDGYPSGPILASSAPNASDLTSGASGWQYFANTGMARPQYTWQFNFDATGLPRGTCYSMYVEVPATGQVIGSTKPELKPFGPFLITAR